MEYEFRLETFRASELSPQVDTGTGRWGIQGFAIFVLFGDPALESHAFTGVRKCDGVFRNILH